MRSYYRDAFGVCDVVWHEGEPPTTTYSVVLVEVWRAVLAGVDPGYNNPTRSEVHVQAMIEPRVRVEDAWMVVGYNGTFRRPEAGEVRRWANFSSRSWSKAITLDGWNAERTPGGGQ